MHRKNCGKISWVNCFGRPNHSMVPKHENVSIFGNEGIVMVMRANDIIYTAQKLMTAYK